MAQGRKKDYGEEAAHHDSALGTKTYWDNHYEVELSNFEDTGDEGEIWFGKSAENRLIRFVSEKVNKNTAILDVGTGNASILRKLRQKGYLELTGIDYSEGAVELARKSSEAEEKVHPTKLPKINFYVADLLASQTPPNLCHKFEAVLDKGTWDAISLSGNRTERLKNYRRSITDFFRKNDDDGDQGPRPKRYFVIFSCNFTKDELVDLFECEDLAFDSEILPTTTICFGGLKGTTSTGVVFRKE